MMFFILSFPFFNLPFLTSRILFSASLHMIFICPPYCNLPPTVFDTDECGKWGMKQVSIKQIKIQDTFSPSSY